MYSSGPTLSSISESLPEIVQKVNSGLRTFLSQRRSFDLFIKLHTFTFEQREGLCQGESEITLFVDTLKCKVYITMMYCCFLTGAV